MQETFRYSVLFLAVVQTFDTCALSMTILLISCCTVNPVPYQICHCKQRLLNDWRFGSSSKCVHYNVRTVLFCLAGNVGLLQSRGRCFTKRCLGCRAFQIGCLVVSCGYLNRWIFLHTYICLYNYYPMYLQYFGVS